jgi:hypothetical protein
MFNLPFTTEQFLGTFERYSSAIGVMPIIAYIMGIIALYFAFRKSKHSGKIIWGVLAFFWLWTGLVYHLLFFTSINKTAWAFGFVFVFQGILFSIFAWSRSAAKFETYTDIYGITGLLFIVYAMIVYPILGYITGHPYPRGPVFGLTPCPATIFSFGIMLIMRIRIPIYLIIIPFLWSLLGFTAAMKLGIHEDTGLLVAGVLGLIMIIFRNKRFGKA